MALSAGQVWRGHVNTTFEDYTMLTGNSLMMGGIICFVWSMIAPEDYDFVSMRQIKMVDMKEDGDMGFTKVRVSSAGYVLVAVQLVGSPK